MMKNIVGLKVLGMVLLAGFIITNSACSRSDGETFFEGLLGLVTDRDDRYQSPGDGDGDQEIELPDDFGEAGPQAFLMTPESGINPYQQIEVRFSETMNISSVESTISVIEVGGDSVAVTARWVSPRRMILRPARALEDLSEYSIDLSGSLTSSGDNLLPESHTHNFHTEPAFRMTHEVNGHASGESGIIINSAAQSTVNVESTLTNPSHVEEVRIYRLGTVSDYISVCSAASCTEDLTATITGSSIPPRIGGNQYYYEIRLPGGRIYKRPFAFNYGPTAADPYSLQEGIAGAVLDNAHVLSLVNGMLERFIQDDFRLNGQTFADFANEPRTNSKRADCNNYGAFQFISTFGDTGQGSGYCNIDAPDDDMTLDVYVTNVNLPTSQPAHNGVTRNANVNMQAQDDGSGGSELGVDLAGRAIEIDLAIVARSTGCIFRFIICVVGSGHDFYFTGKAILNLNQTPTEFRLSRSRGIISADSNGALALNIKNPFTPDDNITENFYVKPWVDNITLPESDINFVSSTHGLSGGWLNDFFASIAEGIASGITPTVQPLVVQAILGDFKQQIAPNVLNAFLETVRDDGIALKLPDYLPSPLDQISLDIALKVGQSSDLARIQGANGGLVSSADVSLTASSTCTTCATPPSQQGEHSFIAVRSGPQNADWIFSQSAAKPGLLLALHEDAMNQAIFNLWEKGLLNLTIDSDFLDTINQYAGDDPLFRVTDSLLRAGTIVRVIAPGQDELEGIDEDGDPFIIDADDSVELVVNPRLAPHVRTLNLNSPGIPELTLDLGNLDIQLRGIPSDGGDPYNIATIRAHAFSRGSLNITEFSNPTGNPSFDNLSALSIQLNPNDTIHVLEVLEGIENNPYGLDPAAIESVANPLVKTFIVPLLNNILREIPLPRELDFPAFTDGGQVCHLRLDRNSLQLSLEDSPAATNPFFFARLHAPESFYNPAFHEPRRLGELIACN